jgi:hypothetical protein
MLSEGKVRNIKRPIKKLNLLIRAIKFIFRSGFIIFSQIKRFLIFDLVLLAYTQYNV